MDRFRTHSSVCVRAIDDIKANQTHQSIQTLLLPLIYRFDKEVLGYKPANVTRLRKQSFVGNLQSIAFDSLVSKRVTTRPCYYPNVTQTSSTVSSCS